MGISELIKKINGICWDFRITAFKFLGRALIAGTLMFGASSPSQAANFSFTGTFTGDADVQLFDFTVGAPSIVTLLTYSYAGGTNSVGAVIPAGGFDPILSLFDSSGLLIDQNDDGVFPDVGIDPITGVAWDTYLETALLGAGDYTVAVSQYDNMAEGSQLSDGFRRSDAFFTTTILGGSCLSGQFCDAANDQRTNSWAFDILNVESAVIPAVPVPAAVWLFGTALIGLVGFGKRRKAA
jgi:hypothetical protein